MLQSLLKTSRRLSLRKAAILKLIAHLMVFNGVHHLRDIVILKLLKLTHQAFVIVSLEVLLNPYFVWLVLLK